MLTYADKVTMGLVLGPILVGVVFLVIREITRR